MNRLSLVITITSRSKLDNEEEFKDTVLEKIREMINNYYWLKNKKFDFTLEGKIIKKEVM